MSSADPHVEDVATSSDLDRAIAAALDHLAATQGPRGSWEGSYGGPMFLLPMFVGTCYAIGRELDPPTREGMTRYLLKRQNDDGGWGLYAGGASQMYTTVLCYVALRLLGTDADPLPTDRARRWISGRGGPLEAPVWGKFFLAVLNLFDYRGVIPTPPELWLLPTTLPMHPVRIWCHSRMVLLPTCYLYGIRARTPLDDTLARIRTELYDQPFERIDWAAHRHAVAETDSYVPHGRLLRLSSRLLAGYERLAPRAWRRRALDHVLDQVRQEDENTRYICLGPVNKLLNLLCWHFARRGGPEVRAHVNRMDEYLSSGPDDVNMDGYHSSQFWDTCFAVRAICAAYRESIHHETLRRAGRFIDDNQIRADPPRRRRYHRDPTRGAWPFSDADNGWPVSDCTAEGLKAALLIEAATGRAIPDRRLRQAARHILWMQNPGGGWASYEKTRGPRWLERLNSTSVFADVMIDYSYPECTSACMQALAAYRPRAEVRLHQRIDAAIEGGRRFLRRTQHPDGSWMGSWGVCFTYGTWFGIWGLAAAGIDADRRAIDRAARFLESKQLADGGWGEDIAGCRRLEYVTAPNGQAVMTAWALLGLARAGRPWDGAIERGVHFLAHTQSPDGSWPQPRLAGVFNKTCGIDYTNYGRTFPLWALAECRLLRDR